MTSAIDSPSYRAALLISDEGKPSHSMHEEASRRGFRLLFSPWRRNGGNEYNLDNLHAVVLETGAGARQLQRTFAFVHHVSRRRAKTANFEPIIVIVALSEFSPSTRVDFLRLGCQVLLRPYPAQLFHLLETVSVENKRRLRRGLKLFRRHNLPPVVVHQGLIAELDLRGRPRRLMKTLSSEDREFAALELAADMGCDHAQVKVYVERLRRTLVAAARKIGLIVRKDEVIRNSGRGTGYRLHADLN